MFGGKGGERKSNKHTSSEYGVVYGGKSVLQDHPYLAESVVSLSVGVTESCEGTKDGNNARKRLLTAICVMCVQYVTIGSQTSVSIIFNSFTICCFSASNWELSKKNILGLPV